MTMSKRAIIYALVLLALLCGVSGCVAPSNRPPGVPTSELAWWPTKALPEPQPDPLRPGYWWWPTMPGEEEGILWGNRGYVYVLRYEGEGVGPEGLPGPLIPGQEKIVQEKLIEEVKPLAELKLEDWVHFEFDKYDLTPLGKEVLDAAAEMLKKYSDVKVILEGHTCSCGTEQYNQALGLRRAEAVKAYLVAQGIAPSRLSTVSYGELRPTVVEKTKADHAKNRRVEFNVRPAEEPSLPAPSPAAVSGP
jgi:outer membrane protein OmpA-like peptidoglycan-associated protein